MSKIRTAQISDLSDGDSVIIDGINTCKAFVNFNGTGTIAIRDDYGVDSLTDNGTGDYTVNLTTDFADTNYTFLGLTNGNSSDGNNAYPTRAYNNSSRAVGSCRVGHYTDAGTAGDVLVVMLAFFGNQ